MPEGNQTHVDEERCPKCSPSASHPRTEANLLPAASGTSRVYADFFMTCSRFTSTILILLPSLLTCFTQAMASVFLGDLDDVIGPSQACVNPIFATDTSTPPSQRSAAPENGDKGRAQVTVEAAWMDVEEAGGAVKPDLIKATGPGSAASVSLNDCLACRYGVRSPLKLSRANLAATLGAPFP